MKAARTADTEAPVIHPYAHRKRTDGIPAHTQEPVVRFKS